MMADVKPRREENHVRKLVRLRSQTLSLILAPITHNIITFFFFKDTATTEIYTLSLHDALPISRTGERADAAFNALGHQLREQVDQAVRVFHPLVGRPIRRINLILDRRAVEAAVGKSVDRENVAVVLVEPFPEGEQRRGAREFARGLIAQAQSDRVRFVRTYPVTHRQRETLKIVERLSPRFAAMNVRAVGEVNAVTEFHLLRKA